MKAYSIISKVYIGAMNSLDLFFNVRVGYVGSIAPYFLCDG